MKNNVVKATVRIFIFTLIAKLLGFVKSIAQASYFGATLETDIFNVAEGFVVNILYMLTTAISVAFVPMYIQHKKKGDMEGRIFVSRAITFFTICIIGVAFALMVLGDTVMKLVAPAYTGAALEQTVLYFRILLTGIVFSLGANLYQQLLNAERIYGFSAISSVINSVVIFFCIILLSGVIGIWSLIVATILSYVCQFLVVYICGYRFGNYTFRYGVWDNSLKILIMQSIPVLISQAAVEINQVVDRALLAAAGDGAITSVSYASVLYGVINGLINIPISTVMFTELSEAGADHDKKRISVLLGTSYKILVLISFPIMIVMFFCSSECIEVVYGHGNYSGEAMAQTAIALKMYGFCILPNALNAVLTKAYYGLNDTKRPMMLSTLSVITNIIVSIILSHFYGIAGVVGGTALAINIWVIVMIINFDNNHVGVRKKRILEEYWKNFLAGIVTVGVMYAIKDMVFINSLGTICIKTIITFGCYGVLLMVFGDKVLKTIVQNGITYIKNKDK